MWSDFDYAVPKGTPEEFGSDKEARDGKIPREMKFPWLVNGLADILPGTLYDVRSAFEARGVKFGPADFAWFNPEGLVLIMRASQTQIDSVEAGMAYSCAFHYNLLLDGEISVGSGTENAQSPARLMPWRVRCVSGGRTNSSATGEGLSYRLEFEPSIGPDGMTIDCAMVFEAKFEGKNFAVTTSCLMYRDKSQTTILGTTKDGEKVELHLKLSYEPILPLSKLDDAQWQGTLLERVQKMVAK